MAPKAQTIAHLGLRAMAMSGFVGAPGDDLMTKYVRQTLSEQSFQACTTLGISYHPLLELGVPYGSLGKALGDQFRPQLDEKKLLLVPVQIRPESDDYWLNAESFIQYISFGSVTVAGGSKGVNEAKDINRRSEEVAEWVRAHIAAHDHTTRELQREFYNGVIKKLQGQLTGNLPGVSLATIPEFKAVSDDKKDTGGKTVFTDTDGSTYTEEQMIALRKELEDCKKQHAALQKSLKLQQNGEKQLKKDFVGRLDKVLTKFEKNPDSAEKKISKKAHDAILDAVTIILTNKPVEETTHSEIFNKKMPTVRSSVTQPISARRKVNFHSYVG